MFNWLFNRNKSTLPKDFRKFLDHDALLIVERLKQGGFESYLVGGCVRDILLNKKPKDFDIATKASPQQIKAMIHRSFIIGRRFRIVVAKRNDKAKLPRLEGDASGSLPDHSPLFPAFNERPAEKEFQITTFRRNPIEIDGKINENVFGTAEEDATRRDFTINALLLDPVTGKIVDFVGGLPDLRKKRLRVIGDPWLRFKEDPIRILRALRFVAKTNLKFEATTRAALNESIPTLKEAKRERVREEILKTLREGAVHLVFEEFKSLGIWDMFSPTFAEELSRSSSAKLFEMEIIFRNLSRHHWEQTQSAPLFYLLFYPWISQERHFDFESPRDSLKKLFDDFKVSRVEREQIGRIHQLLARVLRDPQAQSAQKLLGRNLRQYSLQAQGFYVLKILSESGLPSFATAWPAWKTHWSQHVVVISKLAEKMRSTSRPHSGFRSRRPSSSGVEVRGSRRTRPVSGPRPASTDVPPLNGGSSDGGND